MPSAHEHDTQELSLQEPVSSSGSDQYRTIELASIMKRRLFRRSRVVQEARTIEVGPRVSPKEERYIHTVNGHNLLGDDDECIDYIKRKHWVLLLKRLWIIIMTALLIVIASATLLFIAPGLSWVVITAASAGLTLVAIWGWTRMVRWLYWYPVVTNVRAGRAYAPPFPFPGGGFPHIDFLNLVNQHADDGMFSPLLDKLGFTTYGQVFLNSPGEDEHLKSTDYVTDHRLFIELVRANKSLVRKEGA